MTSAASEDLRWVQKRAFPGPPGGREGFGKGFGKGYFWKGLAKGLKIIVLTVIMAKTIN